jgi:rhamnosyltransferase
MSRVAGSAREDQLATGRVFGREGSPEVSIILPVKNGERDLPAFLAALRRQITEVSWELVAIDSGSTDATVDLLVAAEATVLRIAEEAFDYGLSRNLAASRARGRILVFITVRALPAHSRWLDQLVLPLREIGDGTGPVAVFSCVLPRPDSDLLSARDQLRARRAIAETRRIGNPAVLETMSPPELRQLVSLHNVSCAVVTDAFRHHPFPAATYGEDMSWALAVLRSGLAIRYEPSSVVLHGHRYDVVETFRRAVDDGIGHREALGFRSDPEQLDASVAQLFLDDSLFFEHALEMRGERLRRALLHSAMRRGAWAIGHWLGSWYVELRSEEDLRQVVTRFPSSQHLQNFSAGFRLQASTAEEAILATFSSVGHDPLEILAHAYRSVGSIAIALLRGKEGPVARHLSLIGAIRRGERTGEMEGRIPAAAYDLPFGGREGDDPLLPSILLLQAEASLLFQKATDAALVTAATRNEILAAVTERDELIRALQRELHQKVGERDDLIRSLQTEMHQKIGEANEVIRQLQARLSAGE